MSLQGKWEEAREHWEGALEGSTGREHGEPPLLLLVISLNHLV